MRGLWKAAILLAPALASAFVVPDAWNEDGPQVNDVKDEKDVDGRDVAIFYPEMPLSPDAVDAEPFEYRFQILPSEEICELGNVLVNGKGMPGELTEEGFVVGEGTLDFDEHVVEAAWRFECITSDEGLSIAQLMTFVAKSIDGAPIEATKYQVWFDHIVQALLVDTPEDFEDAEDMEIDFETEMAELDQLRAEADYIYYLIREKERALGLFQWEEESSATHPRCHRFACFAKKLFHKAKAAIHRIIWKIKHKHGKHGPPCKHRHGNHTKHGKHHWPPHGNHTHGNCSHPFPGKGNHTFPFPGKGNHTHPPHKRPHFRPPFCHCPPPHHGPPHHGPPHHGPPHHGPPHHGPPHHGPPHHGPPHHGPPHHGPPHHGPPHHGPPPPCRPGKKPHWPPHEKPEFPFPKRPQDGPPPPPDSMPFEFDGIPPPPPPMRDGPPHRRPHPLFIALHVAKFVVIGVLLSFVAAAVRRRCCNASRRAEKQARREERHRRRAFRRAAKKLAWRQWFASFVAKRDEEEEEKRAMLAGRDDAVGDEIRQLSNAASVVGDIIAAEEGRGRVSIGSLPDYRSEIGEDLPSYQDSDGSEASSYVADGFGYTPGSSEYVPSPARSDVGSVRNVLGDTKE